MSDARQVTGMGDGRWQEWVSESLPGVVWSTDRTLRLVTCQGSGLAAIEGVIGQLRGRTLAEILGAADGDAPPIVAHLRALAGTAGPIECNLGGRSYHGHVAPLHVDGAVAGCVALMSDAPWLDARHASIVNTMLDLHMFLDTQGVVQEVNRAAAGLPLEHILHHPIYDFMPVESREPLRAAIASVLETGRVATLEVRFVRRFGQPAWQLMRLGPIQRHGKITGLVLLASDITQHKVAIQRLQAEEDLLRELLELQDRERRMVAYDIHDGFIQDVVGARMMLQGLRSSLSRLDSAAIRRFDSAVALLAHAVNDGRRLIGELRPMIIDEMGIVDAMEFLIGEEEARGGLTISFDHRIQRERLPGLLQATLFRITRESINNARRHGAATQIQIRLTQIGEQYLILEIQDNGGGFDLDSVPHDRYGLAGIRERAQLFGGGATIESSPQQGTRITVKLALDATHEKGTKET